MFIAFFIIVTICVIVISRGSNIIVSFIGLTGAIILVPLIIFITAYFIISIVMGISSRLGFISCLVSIAMIRFISSYGLRVVSAITYTYTFIIIIIIFIRGTYRRVCGA